MASAHGEPSERDPFPRATLADYVRRTLRLGDASGDAAAEIAWARSILTPAELELWSRQSAYDRSHAVRVAHRVARRLAGTPWADDARWPAAALLHDVGKPASLSIAERIAANLARRAVGLDRARSWSRRGEGLRRRLGVYLTHGEAGAAAIRAAGGRDEAAAWAEVHQTHGGGPVAGIPGPVVAALLASDTG
ncbi:MAG TPA: HD domain-containing protein [Thermoanaerobaculia bacterium]|nr:HD domain-containing protein [Thermoanaerobaculia bacterium]